MSIEIEHIVPETATRQWVVCRRPFVCDNCKCPVLPGMNYLKILVGLAHHYVCLACVKTWQRHPSWGTQ